jgi:hypothetical protein
MGKKNLDKICYCKNKLSKCSLIISLLIVSGLYIVFWWVCQSCFPSKQRSHLTKCGYQWSLKCLCPGWQGIVVHTPTLSGSLVPDSEFRLHSRQDLNPHYSFCQDGAECEMRKCSGPRMGRWMLGSLWDLTLTDGQNKSSPGLILTCLKRLNFSWPYFAHL